MLHPVGPRAPAVYWRRRIVVLCAVLVLVVLSLVILGRGTGAGSAVSGAGPSATHPASLAGPTPSVAPATPSDVRSAASTTRPAGAARPASATHSVAAAACTAAQLQVSAVVGQSAYRVGDTPIVMLQVINGGPSPCVQDLADRQVELRIYNGEARVWGSHDCEIQPGTDLRTLAVGQAVRVSIIWSGLSSQPACGGTRQRVGAGTYTLYPLLSGRLGAAAQFSIS